MVAPAKRAAAPSKSLSDYQETVVRRDGNRPIAFSGRVLAKVSMNSGVLASQSIAAAIYETRGGKFVSALSKEYSLSTAVEALEDPDTTHRSGEFHKAQVFNRFDEAVAWFRPGRLTDALRKQLGLDEPERID